MQTVFFLMAQYGGRPIIPIDQVRQDYFSHLSLPKMLRKISEGQLPLILVNMEESQKTAKGVPIEALADYLDARMAAAKIDYQRMYG